MIKAAGLSDKGLRRQSNQDVLVINESSKLYLVADGMGGTAGGAQAAQITAATITDFIQLAEDPADVTWPFGYKMDLVFEANALSTALQLANLKVWRAAEETKQYTGMGSTVVVVWVRRDKAFWSHIGDSRLHFLRGDELLQLSEDHSLVQEQLKRGVITEAEAKTHALKHVVTRSVGRREPLEVEVSEQSLEPGNMLMLCSDGLTNCVEPSALRLHLRQNRCLEDTCQALIEAANRGGGSDNITAVLLQYSE